MPSYLIEIPPVLESLKVAVPFMTAVLEQLPDLPERDHLLHDLALVGCEALTNAIRHAGEPRLPVRLLFSLAADGISISVTDHGAGFDPETVKPPDFEGHPEGGFGLFIMKSIMDQVRYERCSEGNTLVLEKKWPAVGNQAQQNDPGNR
jgi:serine/threonine-protein kinase RsbW